MSKLTQEELLDVLASWFGLYKFHAHGTVNEYDKQTYTQLKEIVGEHFKSGIADRVIDGVASQMLEGIQQKPTVTREWLWGKIGEFPLTSGMELPDIMTTREKYLVGLLNEAGVEVVE